ncbi:MAG: ABC transporter ATP-binding protein [Desulfamplus sp.]|nr:ABC transporter ATP-binding protein [Desulfamplus sp.]
MFAIEAINISKVYRLYKKPSDRLKEFLVRKPLHTPFSSLSDVSFSVPFGESLGIIGDNGAGKSTMLKIVAGTLTPSSGILKIRGRVAALLELGAGFHYEFTGRQNIWINASLMGLDRDEIRSKEKSIIDFSELGDFIDRPIKTYSSGMVVRLAFSIATSVDPEILIIDEALSVGDHYFQKKCIDRMVEFKNSNKTILFCSHAMFTVNQLCDRVLWFDKGRIREAGRTTHITANYDNYNREKSNLVNQDKNFLLELEQNAIPVMVKSIRLNGSADAIKITQDGSLDVEIEYENIEGKPFFIAAGIRRNDDLICHAANMAKKISTPLRGKGCGKVTLQYKNMPFLHGQFYVVVCMMDDSGLQCFHKKESSAFSVLPEDKWENEIGLLKLDHEWDIDCSAGNLE